MGTFKKRIPALFLCISLLLAAFALPAAAEEPQDEPKPLLLGDLNGDGQRTTLDYIMLKRHVLGTYVIPEEALPAADIDGNGSVDATDYLLLKRHLLGTYVIPGDPTPKTLQFAIAFAYFFRTGDRDQLLALEGELGFKLESLDQLVVDYLATLSIEGEELLELEEKYALRLDTLLDLLLNPGAEPDASAAQLLQTALRHFAAFLQFARSASAE